MTDSETETLFSYGSLREEAVQRAVFGRTLKGSPDAIMGYRLEPVRIADANAIAISGRDLHHILDPTGQKGDSVEGVCLRLTPEELRLADAYEDARYRRGRVALRSGAEAWVYLKAE
jgi:gamma-glutamylcyclotransferase (GGCT)/AIG2-like uncharacterized protein YtfP